MSTKLNKNNIKCAVFDLDGTLLNTVKTINYYLNYALSLHGLSLISEEDTMSFVGNGAVKLVERTLNRVGGDFSLFDSLYKTYNDAYNSDPYYLTGPYEGIVNLLSELKNRGIRLGVLSNKPDFAVKAAVDHFFPDTFDVVYGARDDVALKPAPDGIYEILKDLGLSAEEIIYVGDSEVDVLTAKNAGIENGIFFTFGFRTRETLISAGAENLCYIPSEVLDFI